MNEEANLKASKMGIKNPMVETIKGNIQDLEQSLNKSIGLDNADLNKTNATINDEIAKLNTKVSNLYESKRNAINKRDQILSSIKKNDQDNAIDMRLIESKRADAKLKLDRWDEVDSQEFKSMESTACPHCGKDINELANKAAFEEFQAWKAKELTDISDKIEQIKAEMKKLQNNIDTRKEAIARYNQDEATQREIVDGFEADITKANDEISAKRQSIRYSAPESDTTKAIREQIQAARDALREAEMEATDTVKNRRSNRRIKNRT